MKLSKLIMCWLGLWVALRLLIGLSDLVFFGCAATLSIVRYAVGISKQNKKEETKCTD